MTRSDGPGALVDVLEVVPKTLTNGLRVLVLRLPHLHSVSHAFMVRTGPRYEREVENGISHLVEHLVFRGTEGHPDSYALNVAVEDLGGEVNGLTQRDATTIHLTVPPRSAAAGLALLGEICTRPLLTGIEVERDVVMEELLDTLDVSGAELDLDVLSKRTLWAGHPLSMPIAGTPATLEGLTEAQCRAHYAKTFAAANAVLVVAGPVDPDEMLQVAERGFGGLPRGEPLPEVEAPIPTRGAPILVQPTDDSQVSVLLTFPAPHENHRDFAALLLLKRILDDGLGSRLRQAVCEQRGLAYSLSASIDAYADAGALELELTSSPRKVVAAVEETLRVLEALKQGPVSAAELERAKVRHRADLEFALDDPSEMCGWFGAMELVRSGVGYEDRLAEVLGVSPEQLLALSARTFDRERAVVTLAGPVDEEVLLRIERLLGREPGTSEWLSEGEDEEA